MVYLKSIQDEDAKKAIELGEFPEEIVKSRELVAIILTQNWCPQWKVMRRWLDKATKDGSSEGLEIDVYELEYNRKPYGSQFMAFKEDVLGNDLVPYVRYYRNGEFIGDSNFVPRNRFFSYFSD